MTLCLKPPQHPNTQYEKGTEWPLELYIAQGVRGGVNTKTHLEFNSIESHDPELQFIGFRSRFRFRFLGAESKAVVMAIYVETKDGW